MKSVVTFVQTGEKLAVTVASVGRDGQPTETKGEGTIKGNDVTWKIVRETQRGTFESTYKGTLVDDEQHEGHDGVRRRHGQPADPRRRRPDDPPRVDGRPQGQVRNIPSLFNS